MQKFIPEAGTSGELRLILSPAWVETEDVFADSRLSWKGKTLIIEWNVKEPQLRRMCTHANDEVWTDSCVEIFLKRPDESEYRNFEFSAAGYALVGHGSSRKGRELYPEATVASIPIKVTLLENTTKESVWKLHAEIDLQAFGLLQEGEELKGKTLEGNIYNCGDGLAVPHFLTYAPIDTLRPDFHQPSFFVPFTFA